MFCKCFSGLFISHTLFSIKLNSRVPCTYPIIDLITFFPTYIPHCLPLVNSKDLILFLFYIKHPAQSMMYMRHYMINGNKLFMCACVYDAIRIHTLYIWSAVRARNYKYHLQLKL